MQKSIIALFLLTASAAFANEAADEQANRATFAGAATRAEVKAEYLSARGQGRLPETSEAASLASPPVTSARSREAVRAEAVQAARVRVVHEQI
jgi:hypothetical protein